MILVDTSVWIDHFRKNNPHLNILLTQGIIASHPLIIGELACGNLKERSNVITWLSVLPSVDLADHHEVLFFIEERRLMGLGIGIVDVHLLASAIISNVSLWTLDKRLLIAARQLGIDYENPLSKKE